MHASPGHVNWWQAKGLLHMGLQPDVVEGMSAYANKQAHIRRSMASSFNDLWRGSIEFITLGVDADNDILDLRLAAGTDLLEVPSLV